MSTTTGRQREITRRVMRKRRKRRRRMLKTILLFFLLILVASSVVLIIYNKKGGSFEDTIDTYKIAREFSFDIASLDRPRASSFASDLVIVTKNVPLDSASLEPGQKGLLLDLTRRKVLYSQSAFEKVYPASITKLMTAVLAFKYGNMDQMVTISEADVNLEENSQVVGFRPGDRATMEQLVNCLLVYSGNDAACAIAETVGGSMENFVSMMNSYAASLGCTGTHFMNPHGLHDDNHYTTPYDIYLMLKEALKYPRFTEITQLPSYKIVYKRADGTEVETILEATDHYLTGEATPPRNVKILGGKTGTTSLAGNCLALLSQNAYGEPYVSIVMGAKEKNVLYSQMNSLLQNINGS